MVATDLLDQAGLEHALAGAGTVIHLASKNVDRDGSGFDVNVETTRRLCRAAREAGVDHVVYVSTVGVYGHDAHRDADESTPVRPDTPFSSSKAAAEQLVLEHRTKGDFRATILRHRFVYGEGDDAVLPRILRAARKLPFLVEGGRARVSLLYAPDLGEIVRRFVTPEESGGSTDKPVYHVTSGEFLSYGEMIDTICETFDYRRPRLSLPLWLVVAPLRIREALLRIDPEKTEGLSSLRVRLVARDNHFSNRKLLRRFPDLSLTPFATGLRGSLDYYRRFA